MKEHPTLPPMMHTSPTLPTSLLYTDSSVSAPTNEPIVFTCKEGNGAILSSYFSHYIASLPLISISASHFYPHLLFLSFHILAFQPLPAPTSELKVFVWEKKLSFFSLSRFSSHFCLTFQLSLRIPISSSYSVLFGERWANLPLFISLSISIATLKYSIYFYLLSLRLLYYFFICCPYLCIV